MKIKLFLYTIALVSIGSCNNVESNEKPNIIFIMADDLGYADLGCYGQQLIQTPNIDRLAAEGTRFTQCYSGAAVCAPARSVLMTGQHTGHTRVRGNFGLGGVKGLAGLEGRVALKDEDITIAKLLKEAGYKTGMVGKWGLGEPNTAGIPEKQGFDEFFGFLNQRRAHSYYPDYLWHNSEKKELPGNNSGKGTDYTHDLFADYAIDFIKKNKTESFFLYVPLCIPHARYELPDSGSYVNEKWDGTAIAYAAMVSRMDRSVGRILCTLKETGIDKNTIVFFTSDNGAANTIVDLGIFENNKPLRGIKRDPYEGGIRVPMIVRYPEKVPTGETSELVWYFADVLPTLCEISSITQPDNVDGISIWPTLTGKVQDLSDRYLYWEFYEMEGWRAVRFGDWKAIQHKMLAEDHLPVELYNLKEDIGETDNLAEEYPEHVKKAEQFFLEAHTPSDHFKWKYLSN